MSTPIISNRISKLYVWKNLIVSESNNEIATKGVNNTNIARVGYEINFEGVGHSPPSLHFGADMMINKEINAIIINIIDIIIFPFVSLKNFFQSILVRVFMISNQFSQFLFLEFLLYF